MASGKVDWILLAAALVSYAVVGTVASDELANEKEEATEGDELKLITRLKDASLTIEQVGEILRTYENQDAKIFRYTVAELVDVCRESLDKCTFDQYWRMVFMSGDYREEIPKLHEYLVYCRRDKMKKYCRDNFAKVAENLINKVSEEDRELVRPYWDSSKRAGILDHSQAIGIALEAISDAADATAHALVGEPPVDGQAASDDAEQVSRRRAYNEKWWKAREEAYDRMSVDVQAERQRVLEIIAEEYSESIHSKYGLKISANEEELYLWKLIRAMNHYKNMYSFFRTLNDDLASVPPFLDQDSLIDTFKFGRIALYFYYEVSPDIFKALKRKIVAESGKRDKREWEDFILQTGDQIVQGQDERAADMDRSTSTAAAASADKKLEKPASKKSSRGWFPKVLKHNKNPNE